MCPQNTSIYHAGDIGWDLYFIESGLVKIELPKDTSILDEEGRQKMRATKEKADSVGLIYRPGNHFGESCLESISGVRRESTMATTKVELYLLSKDSLDNIFRYTPLEERESLKQKLLSRNGNVWHSFDDSVPEESSSITQSSRNLRHSKSPTSFLSWTRPQRYTLLQGSSKSPSNSFRRSTKKSPAARKPRLRSFSAEASSQLLSAGSDTKSERSSMRESLSVLHENLEGDVDPNKILDAIEAARVIQSGLVRFDEPESASEDTSILSGRDMG
jgi:CRP-like cAMP-binding protein